MPSLTVILFLAALVLVLVSVAFEARRQYRERAQKAVPSGAAPAMVAESAVAAAMGKIITGARLYVDSAKIGALCEMTIEVSPDATEIRAHVLLPVESAEPNLIDAVRLKREVDIGVEMVGDFYGSRGTFVHAKVASDSAAGMLSGEVVFRGSALLSLDRGVNHEPMRSEKPEKKGAPIKVHVGAHFEPSAARVFEPLIAAAQRTREASAAKQDEATS